MKHVLGALATRRSKRVTKTKYPLSFEHWTTHLHAANPLLVSLSFAYLVFLLAAGLLEHAGHSTGRMATVAFWSVANLGFDRWLRSCQQEGAQLRCE